MYSIEEFDKQKTKVMKYIIYKKRTEQEVKNKFINTIPNDMLEEIIEYVKEAGYINDSDYIEKAVNEFINLKNLSMKEVQYKLIAKGIDRNKIEDYIYENMEELEQYEKKSAMNIYNKKIKNMEIEEIKNYLLNKGYKQRVIKEIMDS